VLTALTAPPVRLFAAAHLVVTRGSTFEGKLLRQWNRLMSTESDLSRMDERAIRYRLRNLFELQHSLNEAVGAASVALCKGHHPKHHLWIEHNRYIYDAIREGDRVIDIGCGASEYQQWIAEKAAEVLGVDLRPERVEESRGNNTRKNVRYELMDVTKSLPAGQFDVAICSHVLEHLDDPVSFLKALALRVPRLIVKVPLADSHWTKLVRKEVGDFWMDDPDHRREYSVEMLQEQFKESGWNPTEVIRGYDLRATATSHLLGPA
jgi:SAM-dependent methyltransferase